MQPAQDEQRRRADAARYRGLGGHINDIIDSLLPLAVPIKDLHEDPRNARRHDKRNLDVIKKSLETYGQRKPIVCQGDGTIEAGNGLYRAAKELGWTQVAVVRVNDDKDYAAGYAVMDNKSAETSGWDTPTLKDLLQELDTGAFDMEATGFSQEELEKLMTASADENAKTMDEALRYQIIVTCKSEAHQAQMLEELEGRGLACQALIL